MVDMVHAFDDGLDEQRCARCQVMTPTSEIVQVPSIGQICTMCDDELSQPIYDAMVAASADVANVCEHGYAQGCTACDPDGRA